MNTLGQSPEHLEASSIAPEELRLGARESTITQSRGKQLGAITGIEYSQAIATTPGEQPSANPANWSQFYDYTQELKDFSEQPKTKEHFLADVTSVLSTDRVENLPDPDEAFLQRSGMQALVYVNGIAQTDRRGNEQSTMRDIHEKLLNAARAAEDGNLELIKGGRNYLAKSGDTVAVNRSELERDLLWLEDDKRIGPNVPPQRLAYFNAYKDALVDLVRLNNRADEEYFRKKSGSVLSERKVLESMCRDPNAMKGASKFALFLAAGSLLVLWGIKDFRNKSLSFPTMILLGTIVFLVGSRSKMNYVASTSFLEATKNGLDGEQMEKLYAFARRKPKAFKAMMDRMKEFKGSGIPEEKRHLLTEPKKNGKLLKDEIVDDEEIVNMMVGNENAPPLSILEGIYKTRNSKGKDVAIQFAEANSTSKGQTADELNHMMSVSTDAEGPYTPMTPSEPIDVTEPIPPGTIL